MICTYRLTYVTCQSLMADFKKAKKKRAFKMLLYLHQERIFYYFREGPQGFTAPEIKLCELLLCACLRLANQCAVFTSVLFTKGQSLPSLYEICVALSC